MIVIKNILILIAFAPFHALGQDHFIIQGDDFDLQIGKLKIEEIFHMDKNFKGLQPLGKPDDIKYEDRFSEELWIYTYPKYILTYVNIGDGPVLFEIKIIRPSDEIKLDGNDLSALDTYKNSFIGKSKHSISKLNSELKENLKFGEHDEYLEVWIDSNQVTTIIYRHDLKI